MIYSLGDHVDDENDLFECGKCKQHFSYLHSFVQHKKICNSRLQQQQHTKSSLSTNSEKLRELAEIELHFGIASTSTSASQPQLVHHTGSNVHHSHHSMGKSLLSTSSNNSSPLLIPSNNNSPTSMMTAVATGGGNGQSTNHLVGDINIINRHLSHGNRASPLIDPLNGSSINVNSILPDNDLLSLTSSLDANMIASIGNSISPSSLLHLQGGDVSSNTDDFAQFAHLNHGLDASTESSMNDVNQHSRSNSIAIYGVTSSTNGASDASHSMLISSANSSSSISTNTGVHINSTHPQHAQQPQQSSVNVINFINSIHNTSPTSFTSFMQNISSNDVNIGVNGEGSSSSSSLLKTSFDTVGDVDGASNDNSIGSPSRFLNLPPPASQPSTPSSIIEHRPNQVGATVRSTQTSSISTEIHHVNKPQQTMNVIHHSQQQHSQQSQTIIINHDVVDNSRAINENHIHSQTLNQNQFAADNQQHNPQQSSQMTNTNQPAELFKCNFCDRN